MLSRSRRPAGLPPEPGADGSGDRPVPCHGSALPPAEGGGKIAVVILQAMAYLGVALALVGLVGTFGIIAVGLVAGAIFNRNLKDRFVLRVVQSSRAFFTLFISGFLVAAAIRSALAT